MLRLLGLTVLAMLAFAANSLLCRGALRTGAIDAASFTAIRLASGALVLLLLARGGVRRSGSWPSALALVAYAVAFSYGYLRVGAGAGSLLVFGAVQLTMIGGGLVRGERPTVRQWIGLLVAAAGMAVINLPSLDAPPPLGAALMIASGAAWGVYSLRGRGAANPLDVTAGNFARAVPFALALAALALAASPHVSPQGAILAIASGALASGVGYAIWYAALPQLGAARGAIVQLSVPVIAALGAVVLLDEPLRRHVAIGGGVVLGGLALALWKRSRA